MQRNSGSENRRQFELCLYRVRAARCVRKGVLQDEQRNHRRSANPGRFLPERVEAVEQKWRCAVGEEGAYFLPLHFTRILLTIGLAPPHIF